MEARFDELIHQPTRLRLMALLYGLGPDARVEFGWLRRELDTTDGNLSVHLQKPGAGGLRADRQGVRRAAPPDVGLADAARPAGHAPAPGGPRSTGTGRPPNTDRWLVSVGKQA